MPESVLTSVVDDRIWALNRPVWFSGARLRVRTTIVRLEDGSLLIHSPAPPTDALAEELLALDHWTFRFGARITGCYERVRIPPDVKNKIPDKAAAARSIQAMLQRPARRLIVGHADVIDAGCREKLAQVWRIEGVDV
jgi:hypothetical protein